MKFCVAVSLLIIASMAGVISVSGYDVYPRDYAGNYYYCGVRKDPDCSKVCKLHGATVGYCHVKRCSCVDLPEKNQNFLSVIWKQC
uniref:Neurotoxin 60.35 n=1 Tax=Lychas mucronatus TaxID=172552 RepID=STX60_LYCMC|nr:RecName: Full=Neurotoxin 60.35; Flags: Precursor [Lychas mucronatus]